jgi:hypothetical protein
MLLGIVVRVYHAPSRLACLTTWLFLTCSDSKVRGLREGSKSDLRSATHKVLGAVAAAGTAAGGQSSPDQPSSARRRGASLEVGGGGEAWVGEQAQSMPLGPHTTVRSNTEAGGSMRATLTACDYQAYPQHAVCIDCPCPPAACD